METNTRAHNHSKVEAGPLANEDCDKISNKNCLAKSVVSKSNSTKVTKVDPLGKAECDKIPSKNRVAKSFVAKSSSAKVVEVDPLGKEECDKVSNKNHLAKSFVSKSSKKELQIITISRDTSKVRKKLISLLPIKDSDPKPDIKLRKFREVDKHQENLATILLNSNATPLKRRYDGDNDYACCFCAMMFSDAKVLKKHTMLDHDDKCKSKFMKNDNLCKFMVKLDITALRCIICDTKFDLLDPLIEHLTLKHNKRFHQGLKNYILPFKFDTDEFQCVICEKEFNFFKLLIEHMNTHYRNYICETCGDGFVNRRLYLNHIYRHNRGKFKCSFCVKEFNARVKQKEHERSVHISMNKKYKCAYCGEKFTNYAKRHDHHVKVHGVKPFVRKCKACDMTFDNQRALTIHTRSYHLMERTLRK